VLAESIRDIPEEFFKFERVGISAGASTPDAVVQGIELDLKKKVKRVIKSRECTRMKTNKVRKV